MMDLARVVPVFLAAIVPLWVATPSTAQERPDTSVELRVVQKLKEHVKPNERLIVSQLYNSVFTTPEERRVLDRLFNTFFRIPLFVAQYKASTNQIPTLDDISRQFNLPVAGEADLLLTIMENDPRVPRFIKRDPNTGEITEVQVEEVRKDRRFGQLLERSLTGWAGRDASPFSIDLLQGGTLNSAALQGKPYLLYFWFSGCPPCVRISPHLVELQKKYGDRNFTVVAVNADRLLELPATDADRAAYVKKAGYNFPVGHLNKSMQDAYGNVSVYPTLFLVNARGVIQKYYVNYQPFEVLDKDVGGLLSPATP